MVVHGSRTHAQVASVGRAPIDALADRQPTQRAADRRKHADAAVLHIGLMPVHESERLPFAMQWVFAFDA
ncbi:hypothetical protein BXOR1_13230 [Xanthomonas oryzae pv. oryzicola]|nr:hypothetical protein BE73_19620 [Xanthomonas oryzae pv. oryzicola]KOR48975.1 hypothetical protein ADT27_05920 [Xanthomonas oryzae]AKK63034.1 hypothetical protein FE36_03745 [Xanthomonas oryzae pv. oryzicola]AKN92387.1 hypothetical protein ACU13_04350 [Xanthomonas oryzae pv. oryzicola]AKN96124.1 hypothetical protein ACU10_04335 [Xanthomonas oryzae pv. oryzicola]